MFFSVNIRNSRGSMSGVADREEHDRELSYVELEDSGRLDVVRQGPPPAIQSRAHLVRRDVPISMPYKNSIRTEDRPSLEVDVTRSTPGAAETICSSGLLINVSISSGPTPSYPW